MAKNAIIFDPDNDGYACAALLSLKLTNSVDFYPVTYNNQAQQNVCEQLFHRGYKSVYMCDMCFSDDRMESINNNFEFYWFDHHIGRSHLWSRGYKGLREDGVAACHLVWSYFWQNFKFPKALEWIGEWDVFRGSDTKHFDDVILPFALYMDRIKSISIWKDVLGMSDYDPKLMGLLYAGQMLWKSETEYIDEMPFSPHNWSSPEYRNGEVVRIMNIGMPRSKVSRIAHYLKKKAKGSTFDAIVTNRQDESGLWVHSIRSLHDDFDCLEFIEAFNLNGGGHVKAAGFRSGENVFSNADNMMI